MGTLKNHKLNLELKVLEYYNAVPQYVKEDLEEALSWAKKTLVETEGEYESKNEDGYCIEVHGAEGRLVCCSFSKPSWSGDHCGKGMDTGSEAIVMAVSEYVNGM